MKLTDTLGKLMLTLLLAVMLVPAQAKTSASSDKLKAKKVAFFTQKLNLNSDEATTFWPIYNEYQEKRDDLLDQRKDIYNDFSKKLSGMSTKEVDEALEKLVSITKEEAELLNDYITKFKEILPDKKVARLFVVEEDYKKFLLQQIRNSANNK